MTSGQVDDTQPPHSEREPRRARIIYQKSIFIRPAVPQRSRHRTHLSLGVRRAICECGATNAAHALVDLRCSQKRESCAQEMLAKMKAGDLQLPVGIPGQEEEPAMPSTLP